MEKTQEKKNSKRILSTLLDEINRLEENILKDNSLIMSEYISTTHKKAEE